MNTKRVVAYDVMNVAACVAVIALHVNGIFWTFSYDRYWKTSLIIETVFYWAVPVFFMLTGATLMDYRERYCTKTFLKKRFERTVVPFIIWSVISIPWAIYIVHYLSVDDVSSVSRFLNTILNCKGLSIYWFFPPLFSIYLCIPVISTIPYKRRKTAFGFLILYGFLSCSLLPPLLSKVGIYLNGDLRSPLNGGYLIFPLIGYWIANYPISKKTRWAIYFAGILGWAIRFYFTLTRSLAEGTINMETSGYTNYPAIIQSVAVFVWFYYHDWSFLGKGKLISVFQKLSSASLGVYLIHFYLMQAIVSFFHIPMQSIIWRTAGIPLVYLISLAAVLIGKKAPIVKHLFP